MINAVIEAMMFQAIAGSLSASLFPAPVQTRNLNDPLEEENQRLRERISRQGARIERLEDALIQVGTATAQIGAAVAVSSQVRPMLPSISQQSSKVAGFVRGQILDGRVNKLHKSGANITIGNYFGFVPKGQISNEWVDEVSDYLHVGQDVRVKIIKVDSKKEMIILSIRQVE